MFKINYITFLVTSVVAVDLASLAGVFLFGDVHEIIFEGERKQILAGFFAAVRVLYYIATAIFAYDFNYCQAVLLVLILVATVDITGLVMSVIHIDLNALILIRSLFVLYDILVFAFLFPTIPYVFFNSNDSRLLEIIQKMRPNVNLVSYIMYFDGIYLVFYVMILATTTDNLPSAWLFIFEAANLALALAITVSTTRSYIYTMMRYLLGSAILTILFLIIVIVAMRKQAEHEFGALTVLRVLIIVNSFLYIFAVLFHMYSFNTIEKSRTFYNYVQVLVPPLLVLELDLIFAYIVYDSMLPDNDSYFNWFVFIHVLTIVAGVFLITARDDIYNCMEWFALASFAVAVYEMIVFTVYVRQDRYLTEILLEAIMFAIPILYLAGYLFVWVVIDYNDNKLYKAFIACIEVMESLNERVWLLPLFRLPLMIVKRLFDTYPSFKSQDMIEDAEFEEEVRKGTYESDNPIVTTVFKKKMHKHLKNQAIGLDRAIQMFFIFPYMLDVACYAAYVLGLFPSKKYEHWDAYGNIFHGFTLLGGYFVLTSRVDIIKHISTQLAFAVFLILWEMVYAIDFYVEQWFGSHYETGFIILRWTFPFVDLLYIIACSAYLYKVTPDVFLYYAALDSVDTIEDKLINKETLE